MRYKDWVSARPKGLKSETESFSSFLCVDKDTECRWTEVARLGCVVYLTYWTQRMCLAQSGTEDVSIRLNRNDGSLSLKEHRRGRRCTITECK